MKKMVLFLLLLCSTIHASTQVNDPQIVINQISDEVASINQAIEESENNNLANLPPMLRRDREKALFTLVINKMRELKDRYATNPYVRISAFSLNLGASVSVGISIEIKEQNGEMNI